MRDLHKLSNAEGLQRCRLLNSSYRSKRGHAGTSSDYYSGSDHYGSSDYDCSSDHYDCSPNHNNDCGSDHHDYDNNDYGAATTSSAWGRL